MSKAKKTFRRIVIALIAMALIYYLTICFTMGTINPFNIKISIGQTNTGDNTNLTNIKTNMDNNIQQ